MGQGLLCFDNAFTDTFSTITSLTAHPATAGFFRLANLDVIAWRSFGNSADYQLTLDAADRLSWSGESSFRIDKNSNSRYFFQNGHAGASAAAQISVTSNAGDFNLSAGSLASGAFADLASDSTFTGGMRIHAVGANPILLRTNSVTRITIGGAGGVTVTGALTVTGNLSFSPTTSGIVGTTTNDAATAGNVGEYVESVVGDTSWIFGSGTLKNATSISLTAGDWDVSGELYSAHNGSTTTEVRLSLNTVSETAGTPGDTNFNCPGPTAAADVSVIVAPKRYSLAAPATLYLVLTFILSAGNPHYRGRLSARRVR